MSGGAGGGWDAVVVGGGPAGAAAARHLARAGRRVLVIEREHGPHHKVCGEFLSFEAGPYLRELGVDPEAAGAVPIDSVRLVSGRRAASARLPFRAFSLSRLALDELLLAQAAAAGAEVRRGRPVRAVAPAADGWCVGVGGRGEALEAGVVFLATGKHDVRGLGRAVGGRGAHDLIGFKLHFRLAPGQSEALARHVEVVLFDGGYAGLQPVEGGRANLCLLVRRARYESLGKRWDRLLADLLAHTPHLAARLRGAAPCRDRPAAVFAIPYGYVHDPDGAEPVPHGLFRLGDQFAVIPSFCGDGVAMALHTAKLAAEAFLTGGGASSRAYHRRARADLGPQVRLAAALSRPIAWPVAQSLAVGACRVLPTLLPALAMRTRIPPLVNASRRTSFRI